MRALLAALALLAPDPSFNRDGVVRIDELSAATGVIATKGGGTLHATDGGLLELDARGRRRSLTPMTPAGTPVDLVGDLVIGHRFAGEYGSPTPLVTWHAGRDHVIPLPDGFSAWPLRVIRRGRGYAALLSATRDEPYLIRRVVVALTADGALDTSWGDGGMRMLPADTDGIGSRAGRIVVTGASIRECGYPPKGQRALLRVQRFTKDGRPGKPRRMRIGARMGCPAADAGDVAIDSRNRLIIAGEFGRAITLLRLRADGRRDRAFGHSRQVGDTYETVRLIRSKGGWALGYTETDDEYEPHGHVALTDAQGRLRKTRRLRGARGFPSSFLYELTSDRRGRIVVAGSLNDDDIAIREDYGEPHLAAWRLVR